MQILRAFLFSYLLQLAPKYSNLKVRIRAFRKSQTGYNKNCMWPCSYIVIPIPIFQQSGYRTCFAISNLSQGYIYNNPSKELKGKNIRHVMVVNKIDLLGEHKSNGTISDVPNVIFISAKKQRHTEVLKESLVDTVLSGNV